jgi:hypothetical protein
MFSPPFLLPGRRVVSDETRVLAPKIFLLPQSAFLGNTAVSLAHSEGRRTISCSLAPTGRLLIRSRLRPDTSG